MTNERQEKMQTASDEYMQFAEMIQDACNPVAILGEWARHSRQMALAGFGTDAIRQHPATYATLGKMMSLCEVRGVVDLKVLKAYDDVAQRADELKVLNGKKMA